MPVRQMLLQVYGNFAKTAKRQYIQCGIFDKRIGQCRDIIFGILDLFGEQLGLTQYAGKVGAIICSDQRIQQYDPDHGQLDFAQNISVAHCFEKIAEQQIDSKVG